ncbi:MAG: SemiSWEET transporter [Limnoraphis robusta]|uniref:MtN3 and saliva related transmembrane protein n=1 Tax=Limnoraphis robusta CS-951 TaxID=1637645 RepID=A0A0F5YKD0_9CYAN|nr:SemiSWEET transporter [Limnoraphis robusta]KKD39218.1 MtN3 and saliva related transmembrane protein [Limnoraphis robusta CS-951]
MDLITAIGLLAGSLTTISFLPQVIKTWKTKSTRDVSLQMFVLFCSGVFLWIVYGLLIGNIPIVATNIVTFSLASMILFFKLKYR